MSGHRQVNRMLAGLEDLNPGLVSVRGTRHWKLYYHGELVGIVPFCFAKEGLAHNTASQLRRAGLRVPGSRGGSTPSAA